MRYRVSERTVNITVSTTLVQEDKYGGWMAVNVGTGVANVLGYDLQPGEGLNFFDAVPVGSIWDSPIQIIVPVGGKVRITRLQYKELK